MQNDPQVQESSIGKPESRQQHACQDRPLDGLRSTSEAQRIKSLV